MSHKQGEKSRKILVAVDLEFAAYLAARTHLTDERGHRQGVRNGHLPTRSVLTDIGRVEVTMPRVNDRLMLRTIVGIGKLLGLRNHKGITYSQLLWYYRLYHRSTDGREQFPASLHPRAGVPRETFDLTPVSPGT